MRERGLDLRVADLTQGVAHRAWHLDGSQVPPQVVVVRLEVLADRDSSNARRASLSPPWPTRIRSRGRARSRVHSVTAATSASREMKSIYRASTPNSRFRSASMTAMRPPSGSSRT
jgi:hypothetical protein